MAWAACRGSARRSVSRARLRGEPSSLFRRRRGPSDTTTAPRSPSSDAASAEGPRRRRSRNRASLPRGAVFVPAEEARRPPTSRKSPPRAPASHPHRGARASRLGERASRVLARAAAVSRGGGVGVAPRPRRAPAFPSRVIYMMSAADDAVSLVDLPREVSARIMRLLDARDLAALRSTCRAFDASLVEAAALEAVRARAPWLLDPACGASSDPDETRVATLRFAELADAADLPALLASESTTVVIDRHGGYHSWGPVVDLLGEEDPEEDREEEDPESPGRATLRRPSRDPQATLPQTRATLGRPSGDRGSPRLRRPRRHPRRVACAATSEAFNVVAGVGGSDPLTILRNASGVPRDFSTGDSRRRSPAASSSSSSPSASSLDRLLASLRVAPDRRAFGPSARVVSIAVGRMHVLCATSRGDAYAWGGDAAGQLGHGAVADRVGLARLALGGEGGDPRGASRTGSRSRRRSKRGDAGAGGGYESPPRWSGGFGGGFKGTTTRRGGSNTYSASANANANAAYRDDDASRLLRLLRLLRAVSSSSSRRRARRAPRRLRRRGGARVRGGDGRGGAVHVGVREARRAGPRRRVRQGRAVSRHAGEVRERVRGEERRGGGGGGGGGGEEGSSGGSEGRGNSSDDDSFRRRPSGRFRRPSGPLVAPRRRRRPTRTRVFFTPAR